jgi:hypothetical protein
MSDTLAEFARSLLRPEETASNKKDFLRVLSVGVAHNPSLADETLAAAIANVAHDRWWGVRELALLTLRTVFLVRPELATREIVERVATAEEISCPGFNDFSGQRHREDIAKAAKKTLDCIVKSRPDLAASVTLCAPQRSPNSCTVRGLDHV